MIPIILFLLSIGLQLAAAVFALLLIRTTGRKLAWIFISLAMLLMAGRRIVSLISLLTSGKEVTFDIPELIALVTSFLLLVGVLSIGAYFRSIRSADRALLEEKARSEAIIAAVGNGISIQDTHFKVLYQNQVHRDIIGDHVGKHCYRAYERRDNVCEGCPVAMSFKDGKIHKTERSGITDKGMVYVEITASPLRDSTGKIIAGIEAVRDITECKRAAEALKESEDKFRSLMEKSLVGVYLIQDGMFKYVNPRLAEIFNYTVEELINRKGPRDLVLPEDWPTVEENLRKRMSGEIKSIHYDFRGITKNKEIINVEVYGSRTAFQGQPMVIGTLLDITGRKKLEEQLRHSQKMEAVGQLAGGVAHDFNNILTAIIGYGNLLHLKMAADDPLKTHVEQILTSSERAVNLVQQLLAFSRKQIISPRPVNINEIVTRVGKLLLRVIGEDIELKTILKDEDITVMADSGQIEQVLINLATNARDAMPDGGFLTISTSLVELGDEYIRTHHYGKRGMYALISVADTGTGMDERTKERIFEPFFTTKEIGKGTGLGLAMVYGIVKQHNGYIDAYSEVGKGTTFKIYLPLIESGIGETRAVESITPVGGTETILVVEDDMEVRQPIKDILERFGYTVIDAVDGEDATNKFMEEKDKVKLLILDVVMPRKDGKEVYEELMEIRPDIKALFISGYTKDVIRKKGILDEGFNLIFKPISPKELLIRVREILDKKGE